MFQSSDAECRWKAEPRSLHPLPHFPTDLMRTERKQIHKIEMTDMRNYIRLVVFPILIILLGCSYSDCYSKDNLYRRLQERINNEPGCVGIAYISDSDTVVINNDKRYPMMSVFKLHESLAVVNALESSGISLDTLLSVQSDRLDKQTWSPMLKEYKQDNFDISVRQLIRYALVLSDNNASNILFDRIISPLETDRFVKTIASDTTFSIRYRESDMKIDHDRSYDNYSTPLSAAILIKQVFNDSILSESNQEYIKSLLKTTTIGQDRLGTPFKDKENVIFAHKTGSGYRNKHGELIAFNDVAYVKLPDGSEYGIAVMIRDYNGTEDAAAELMSEISDIIYNRVTNNK